jgi:subtilase family serine protease
MPALPVSFTGLSASQAAQLGAGQTIYIVDAMHDPNVQNELTAFNQKFGLPACTAKAIAASTALPLATASNTACELSIVYTTAAGAITSTAPAYNAGWATEITLDVQWAHATAPLARIILIEAPDASLNSLVAAIKLANAMGSGVVSMSFGSAEGSWTASVDSAFTGKDMSYLAATGDNGASVSWPSVSSNVLAVGGTSLTYSGSGSRSEVSWAGTGGGTSAYTSLPSYQNNTIPGFGTATRRTVADVAFNADPSTGQYVAVIASGSTTVNWVSAGGTSLSTPQWAGLIAIANATRKLNAKGVLGTPHTILYGAIATVPGTYASSFNDIAKGSNGSCAACTAKSGYDLLSGLGTPNISSLLTNLSGIASAPVAPVVTPAGISGKTFVALSFTVAASAANPLSYTLSGAPAGMAISSTGIVTWPTPVVGTYAVTAIAKDSKTGLSGQGLYTVTIAAQPAPVVSAATITGKAGTPLTFNTTVNAPNPVTYTLSGAPSGMSINTSGTVSWASPVSGGYQVTVTAKDNVTALTGKAIYTVTIAAQSAPVVSATTITGKAGTALSFTVSVTAANTVSYSLSGAPAGMVISSTGIVTWPTPVVGTYAVTVIAKDSKTGLSGQGIYTVTIAAQSVPVVSAATVTGKVGTALSFNVSVTAPNPVSYTLSGAPTGMTINSAGLISWSAPALGNYAVTVIAKDSKTGLSGQAVITIAISAVTASGPVITASNMTGVAGKALTGTISISDPGVSSFQISISGAPLGVGFSTNNGTTITLNWPSPVAGNYSLKVSVVDSANRTAQLTIPITINAK